MSATNGHDARYPFHVIGEEPRAKSAEGVDADISESLVTPPIFRAHYRRPSRETPP